MDNAKAVELISDEAVQAALTANLGKDAKLDSWKSTPFTKKGDNYASYVTGIHVEYTMCDKKEKTSYVVKLNPCRPQFSADIPDFDSMVFEKEGKFYLDLLPELNLIMTQSGQKLLPFPKCYYAQYEKDKELIIFEDLRVKDFKMTDRRAGMDLQHATLVMQGLGQLHAASIIMQNKKSLNNFRDQYPWLFKEIWQGKFLEMALVHSVSTGKEILSKFGGHEKAIKWMENIIPNIEEFFLKNLAICKRFNAICHGDCWNNNILFRYNESGLPVEVMLLDVQVNKMASLATDLNHFMFASLTGTVRKPNVDRLLTDYYASLSSVIEGCSEVVPFTKKQLSEEYKSKNAYGIIFGCAIVPPIVMESEAIPDLENITADKFEEFMADWQKRVLENVGTNPVCKPRLISMFDEMLEEGLFS